MNILKSSPSRWELVKVSFRSLRNSLAISTQFLNYDIEYRFSWEPVFHRDPIHADRWLIDEIQYALISSLEVIESASVYIRYPDSRTIFVFTAYVDDHGLVNFSKKTSNANLISFDLGF
jgi:hypothetical protein